MTDERQRDGRERRWAASRHNDSRDARSLRWLPPRRDDARRGGTVVSTYRATGNDLARTHEALSMLSREQIGAALAYYARTPERVDEDIERNARALAELKGERWPVSV